MKKKMKCYIYTRVSTAIYRFLGTFNELYSECTDAEKKQFMQAFIERTDIFPERRGDGKCIA